MKVQELIKKFNESEVFYYLWDAEDAILPSGVKCVKRDINIDRHRWYEVSTSIYKCEDGFVGIRGVSKLYSEMMTFSDCDIHCEINEYKETTTISYTKV